ncbi:TRAP transporter substrate-binding protein [Pseudochelatococcus sp. B33]
MSAIKSSLAAFAIALSVGLTSTLPATAETVTIRYSNWLPQGFWLWEDVLAPWLKEIEQVTEGRVKVEVTPKVVGTAASQYDVIRDGLADLSWMTLGYTPGRFPYIEFGDLGQIHPKSAVLSPLVDKIYREELAQQEIFRGVVPLSLPLTTPLQIVTKGRNISSVEELKGAKLRIGTPALAPVLESLGAVPILKSAAEAYEMLSSGQIDGQVTNLNTVTGFNQLDLLDGVFHIPGGLGNAVNILGLHEATWDRISPADQAAIMSISGPVLAARVGQQYDLADERALETVAAAGYYMGKATPEQIEQVRERVQPVEDAWIARAKAAGLENAAEILERYKAEAAAVSQ